jgi:hypothetical protein
MRINLRVSESAGEDASEKLPVRKKGTIKHKKNSDTDNFFISKLNKFQNSV